MLSRFSRDVLEKFSRRMFSMRKDRKTRGSSPDCTPRASKASKKSTSKDHWGGIPSKEERKHGIETLEDVFDLFDPQDGTGGLTAYRFNKFLEKVGVELDLKDLKILMRQIDLNGDGLIQKNEMRAFFKAAKSRAEMQNSATSAVRDKQAWAKRFFDEFKSKRQGQEGVRESEYEPIAKLLKRGYENLTDTDLKHCFTGQLENGVVSVGGMRTFLRLAEERDWFKAKVSEYQDWGDIERRQVFDHFSTQQRLTGASFAVAVDFLPPVLWPPADINRNAMKQITTEYKDMSR